MRSILVSVLLSAAAVGCGGGGGNNNTTPPVFQCSDGQDNDADGMTDFPEDLGCVAETDESEDSFTSAKCDDGRDNDDDGLTDYPADPGCFAPQADDEIDDCPDGPQCPECGDQVDNDDSGAIDFPNDPGCTSAGDDLEFLQNPVACGAGLTILPLPTTGTAMGTLDGTNSKSMIMSPCGGGAGAAAFAYELHLSTPRVVEISTDNSNTTADTVIDIRSEMCSAMTSHITCNDDVSSSNPASKVTTSLQAGDYYVIVSGHDSGATGTFELQVKTYAGEGTTCATETDCGPGLVCRVPLGASAMVCSKPMCDDGVDDDADGKNDYPTDPGCTSTTDNDETDDCPNGANCPECGDGDDNDGDTKIDYPLDVTCLSAGDSSESCVTTDGVSLLTLPMTTGDTATMTNNDVMPTCGTTGTHTSPDRTYRLDVPALSKLDVAVVSTFSNAVVLYDSTCGGTPVVCDSFSSASSPLTTTNLAAGTYFLVVDGYSTGMGTYTITTSGKIQNGASCESALAVSGALTCGTGYTCKGPAGSRTCQPGLCGDGIDNDTDGKIDFPYDPGCESVADDTEANPNPVPACGNGTDDDTDSMVDWPNDYGCTAASGTSEVFCMAEVDPTSLASTTPVAGTTAGKAHNLTPSCRSTSTAPETVHALSLPVPVATLVIDTIGSGYDTTLHVRDASCMTELACDDDGGGNLRSKVTMLNVQPGNLAIAVDGYSTQAGAYTLNIKGTVAPQTACSSPLFSGGTAAILACPTGTTCSGAPLKCQ